MKKVFILIALSIIAFGCYTPQRIVISHFVDFQDYSKEGFFISPDPYQGKFESLGLISIDVYPGKEKSDHEIKIDEVVSDEEMLNMAVEMAKEKGANGLVNYSVSQKYIKHVSGYMTKKITYSTVFEIRGLAIKITD